MSKRKSTILLSIISVLMALLLVFTFIKFPVGEKDKYVSPIGAIELDYDVKGGYAYELEPTSINDVDDIDSIIEVIQSRLEILGYENAVVKAIRKNVTGVKDYRIRIEVSTLTDANGEDDIANVSADIKEIATYGELNFSMGASKDSVSEIFTDIGNPIKSVKYEGATVYNGETMHPVTITFTNKAYDELMKNIDDGNTYLLIKIGDTELPLFGDEAISKNYFNGKSISVYPTTEDYAKRVVMQIQSGGLPYEYEVSKVSPIQISSLYGENIRIVALITILALIACIIAFMFVMFKGFGFVSAYTMLLFALAFIWLLCAIPGIKLSLGGIIGFVLAIVLAGDGIIITIKRIREEYSKGKTVKAAVKTGLSRALLPIISSCLVVAVISLVAFIFAIGQVKSLTMILGVGAVVALISGLLFIRLFTAIFLPLSKNKESFLNLKREDA